VCQEAQLERRARPLKNGCRWLQRIDAPDKGRPERSRSSSALCDIAVLRARIGGSALLEQPAAEHVPALPSTPLAFRARCSFAPTTLARSAPVPVAPGHTRDAAPVPPLMGPHSTTSNPPCDHAAQSSIDVSPSRFETPDGVSSDSEACPRVLTLVIRWLCRATESAKPTCGAARSRDTLEPFICKLVGICGALREPTNAPAPPLIPFRGAFPSWPVGRYNRKVLCDFLLLRAPPAVL